MAKKAAVPPVMTASEMGKRGGTARAANLTPEQRSAAARAAVQARWAQARAAKGEVVGKAGGKKKGGGAK